MLRNKILKFVFTPFMCMSVLAACDLAENYTKVDRSGDMVRGDYRKAMDGKPAAADPFSGEYDRATNMPEMLPLSGTDERSNNITGNIPVVSVSVNQAVPVRDILFDLASRAEFNLILDPAIEGSIIYSAKSKSFDQVIAEISDLAGLKYSFNGRNLRVELDRPYMKRYSVPYLNITRGFESSVSASVSVATGDSGGGGNGSSYSLNTASDSDFWTSLGTDIAQIMDLSEEFNAVLRTSSDPDLEIIQVAQASTSSSSSDSAASDTQGGTDEAAAADNTTAETTDTSATEDSTISESGGEEDKRVAFIINRLAGFVTVFGTSKQQQMIEEYINDIKRSVGTQILIEAKVLEVELNDEYSAGISWSTVFKDGLGITNLALTAGAPALVPQQSGAFTFTVDAADIDSTVTALNRFGTVRALASPRLSVMNNQSASLNVARNQVFFNVAIEEERDDAGNVTNRTITSDANTVPEGVIINVMPVADPETNEIIMSVRPSITRVDSTVNDPGVAFIAAQANLNIASQVPVVDIREIDTMVKMMSGEVVVIGGLMQDRSVSEQEGIPVASDVPIFGSLFRNQGDKTEKYELVILLRAIVLDGRSNVHPTDKYMYTNFGQDRRPFKM